MTQQLDQQLLRSYEVLNIFKLVDVYILSLFPNNMKYNIATTKKKQKNSSVIYLNLEQLFNKKKMHCLNVWGHYITKYTYKCNVFL